MAEAKQKKIRIYNLATEYNLSADNLVEFLREKGFKVKSHMSMLNEEMIASINEHYKKDIEKAEKHYKKVAEFHKKRAEKAIEDAVEAGTEIAVEETAAAPEPEKIKITDKVAVEEETEKDKEEAKTGTEEKVESKDEKTKESPKQKIAGKQKGLKVIGKIDLGEDKKPEKTKDKEATEDGDGKATAKKKRKPRMRRKAGDTKVEETPVAKKKKRVKKFEINEQDVKAAIKKTF